MSGQEIESFGGDTLNARLQVLHEIANSLPYDQNISEKIAVEALINFAAMDSEAFAAAREAVHAVSEYARQFDYVLVTGTSGVISQMLLQATGVQAEKFIVFDAKTNYNAYKRYLRVNYKGNVQATRDGLEERGVRLDDPLHKPSICVVDERISTGFKLISYVSTLGQIEELGDFAFTAFAAPVLASEASLGESLEKLRERVFEVCVFPGKLEDRVDRMLTEENVMNLLRQHVWVGPSSAISQSDQLFYILEYMYKYILDPSSPEHRNISPETTQIAQEMFAKAMARIAG